MTNIYKNMFVRSVTREMKPTIKKDDLRRAITKIHLCYEQEREKDFGTRFFYVIWFKENTVKSCYEGEYMDSTECPGNLDINEWLDEVAYLPRWYGEEE